ncbi:MAG: DNA cytosine methyltransferase [Gordonia sp.]|uniref:DNA cytosine methyltransferase n=1 Tax=Gordonia sp. (in: high G+C Gram-positive bacteria) TaxID=84139 RepID=UPI000C3ADF90|nr:DNA cytosine methyltransferase [Gordonia sp. (in: high G+C Gram-positive bacteria)]MAU84687.1 DNA cytosine methyltransferase [Gordonia sp. (in: high G+C Gram-positive bacteria)]
MAHDSASPDEQRNAPQIVDLFAGPGGLDVAAHWLGVPTTGIEWDDGAFETRRAAGILTNKGDVRKFAPSDFPMSTVLAAGPPCQTFTVAGSGSGRKALDEVLKFVKMMAAGEDVTTAVEQLDDERTGLVLEPLKWLLAATAGGRPYDAVILEQVPAVLPVWEAFEEALQSMGVGYKTRSGVLQAEAFGVPQTRRRAVLIANRHFQPELPSKTHERFTHRARALQATHAPAGRPCVGIWDALRLSPSFSRDYPFEVVSNYGSGGNPSARGRRLHTEPAATVTGKITRNRVVDSSGTDRGRFSHSEAGLLQTFPYDFPWSGKDIGQQIGNAIPPRLGVHVISAALGLAVDTETLDRVVAMSWAQSAGALAP